MKILLFLPAFIFCLSAHAQSSCSNAINSASFHGNYIRTHYTNVGSIFLDPDTNPTIFPYFNEPNEWKNTRGVTSLWLAAKNGNGQIIDAGVNFPLPEFGDFCPGPIDGNGNTSMENCNA